MGILQATLRQNLMRNSHISPAQPHSIHLSYLIPFGYAFPTRVGRTKPQLLAMRGKLLNALQP